MRLDHLLSKEEVGVGLLSSCQGVHEKHCREFVDRRMDEEERENLITEFSGGDAPRGHTRTHPEHDG